MAQDWESVTNGHQIYCEIFGVERPTHGSKGGQDAHKQQISVPDRFEQIDLLQNAILGDIQDDMIPTEAQNYILAQHADLLSVSDTQSLSSNDDGSITVETGSRRPAAVPPQEGRPLRPDQLSMPPSAQESQQPALKLAQEHARPLPPPLDTSVLGPRLGPHKSVATSQPTNYSPQRSHGDAPKLKSSFSQLSMGATHAHPKKQVLSHPSSSNLAAGGPKKSPLQSFGFFSRPGSKDCLADNHHPNAMNSVPAAGYNNSPTSRSMSFTSSSLKNFASSLQHKTSSGRTVSQKHHASSNPFYETQYQNQVYHPHHPSATTQSTMGLGLKTRSSSASLNSSQTNQNTRKMNSGSSLHFHRKSSASLHSKPILSTTSMKRPQVYPAMLSRVATRFKKSVQLGEYKKDGLLYRDTFTGQQAVDVICSIVRTSDRNLALLLGRALDAQKLFHDVVYEHRLRDSPNEVYEFTGNSRIIGGGSTGMIPASSQDPLLRGSHHIHMSSHASKSTLATSVSTNSVASEAFEKQMDPAKMHQVNGVFTLLAECYVPTCSRNKLCYSISCPRRLEQQARLNLKPNSGLKRNISMAVDDEEEEKPSWTSSVPKEVWSSLSKKEIKRQEAIYEVFITEKNFVKSLEVIRDTFMKSLAETNIIAADIRKNFLKHVFAHVNDIYSVNRRFLDGLSDRQKSSPIVEGIGDLFLRFIPFFEPFVMYVASRPYAKYLIETQRSVNPYFARFDEDLMNSSLRHGIDSFLSQGVSRPGRYILLVREIIKSSDPDKNKRDLENLNKALEALREFMTRIDRASGASQDRHDIELLKQKILFKNEYVNLGLNDGKRKIKHEGILSRKELTKSDSTLGGDIQFYLLDNMLLFLKAKAVNKWQQHKVFQRPIPLPLLFACAAEDLPPIRKYINLSPESSGTVIPIEGHYSNPRNAITFLYYGAKHKYQVTLYAAQYAAMQTLLEKIKQEQALLQASNDIFNVTKVSSRFFDFSNKINSVASCDGGRKLLIATNLGLYISDTKREVSPHGHEATTYFATPVRILYKSISQVAVLEEFQSVLVLMDKKLYSCPLALLKEQKDGTQYFKKHAKELVNHVNFFSEGDCDGKRLVVTAHSSSHSIKYFEHDHPMLAEGKKNVKRKINEIVFESEPVSISFLKTNLCIGCKKGFQIVSVSQNVHEPLLDPADTSLEFAFKDVLKPLSIYRVGASMFLLCYSEFAFFVNSQGWRKKESYVIHWEGEPQKFTIWYPYILAFDANFIEIRKIDTGELVRCVLGDKIRLLQATSQQILYAYEDENGYDTVVSLDFWSK
ncbi:LAME_0F02278g1_1 [Lachancea meyersii CBS 8951]|uniref:LAME_0F02278g1_1 n=1 Tax=Lachancea meyersii CBS 8951 TaxID=1266667 RepID=A0A1G4JQF2_9SACH|nr:LAME_0F02278g1_1 [Lachancea meyersii CBS 8951]